MSRTVTATLVFENERYRETWLEEHGLIPPKHGEYTGVAERIDYEQRRDQPVLVFTVAPLVPKKGFVLPPLPNADKHAAALQKLKDMHPNEFAGTLTHVRVVDAPRVAEGPPDGPIPFPGRFHHVALSALTGAQIRELHVALRLAAKKAPTNAAFVEAWLDRLAAWAVYRGVAL